MPSLIQGLILGNNWLLSLVFTFTPLAAGCTSNILGPSFLSDDASCSRHLLMRQSWARNPSIFRTKFRPRYSRFCLVLLIVVLYACTLLRRVTNTPSPVNDGAQSGPSTRAAMIARFMATATRPARLPLISSTSSRQNPSRRRFHHKSSLAAPRSPFDGPTRSPLGSPESISSPLFELPLTINTAPPSDPAKPANP